MSDEACCTETYLHKTLMYRKYDAFATLARNLFSNTTVCTQLHGLTVGSFPVQIPSASSFSQKERVGRRTQPPEFLQRAAPADKVWRRKKTNKKGHTKRVCSTWNLERCTQMGLIGLNCCSLEKTCVQFLWSWWNRGWGWASCAGWSGGWGGAFCLTYRARSTPKHKKVQSLTKWAMSHHHCLTPQCSALPRVPALLPEAQSCSLTVRPWGKLKQPCFWVGAAAVMLPLLLLMVLEWLWMELKSRGWWRPSCCSFSGFCVRVAENSSFCSGIWGGDRLRGETDGFWNLTLCNCKALHSVHILQLHCLQSGALVLF